MRVAILYLIKLLLLLLVLSFPLRYGLSLFEPAPYSGILGVLVQPVQSVVTYVIMLIVMFGAYTLLDIFFEVTERPSKILASEEDTSD